MKKTEPHVLVLLPAYNEEENIVPLLERIRNTMEPSGLSWDVVVVDDGSRDRTAELAASVPFAQRVTVVPHGVNKGLAEAMRTALRYLADYRDENAVGVAMDADNTHNPVSIPRMARMIQAGRANVVIASRFTRGGEEHGLTAKRKLLSRGALVVMKMLFRVSHVNDFTCGYRAYDKALVERAFARFGERFIQAHGFSVMTEILLKLRKVGLRAREVPLILEYQLKGGASKMRLGRTLFDYLRMLKNNLFL